MSVLNKDCLFNFGPCSFADIFKQWAFILTTLYWTIIALLGIRAWHQQRKRGIDYNQAIIFMVILKFYLIWIAVAWGSSLMMLFIIFWFQACLNVVNCFILHTIV